MTRDAPDRAHLAAVLGVIGRRMLADRGAVRVALVDDGGPDAALAAALLEEGLGAERVARVTGLPGVEPLLQTAAGVPPARAAEALRGVAARLLEDAVPAHPASKTVLLLAAEPPPEPFLPLGDLYASEVATLAGGWSGPDDVRALAASCGGIEVLDAALRARFDARDAAAADRLAGAGAGGLRTALARARAARMYARIVPKLGPRTLYVDLYE